MTEDVRREFFDDHAPQHTNEAFAADGVSAAA